ncbi:hypothetical protein CPC08DRAFT_509040 [Agrocybe pediades]|nr:hypothetical protein CPC08DRAFT_509040 [Agrocybe pediades]
MRNLNSNSCQMGGPRRCSNDYGIKSTMRRFFLVLPLPFFLSPPSTLFLLPRLFLSLFLDADFFLPPPLSTSQNTFNATFHHTAFPLAGSRLASSPRFAARSLVPAKSGKALSTSSRSQLLCPLVITARLSMSSTKTKRIASVNLFYPSRSPSLHIPWSKPTPLSNVPKTPKSCFESTDNVECPSPNNVCYFLMFIL